jgi:hypothetical protein
MPPTPFLLRLWRSSATTAEATCSAPVESRKMNIRLDLAGRRGVCHLTILVRVSFNSNHINNMSVPVPQLKQTGKEALDQFLQKTVQDKKVPATFLGATNKDGELYFDCGGDRVFGKPDEGQVTHDTGQLCFNSVYGRYLIP